MSTPTTPFELAARFMGLAEVPGAVHNPQILAMLRLDGAQVNDDETAWCSAFVNYIAWLMNLPRSRQLNARSWLDVGIPIQLSEAKPGWDVCIFWRGSRDAATGHVAFFSSSILYEISTPKTIMVLGGNQGDKVSIAGYPAERLLGVRRLKLSP